MLAGISTRKYPAALGLTDDGTKVPLGVAEGATENAAVCGRLVANLVDRGLDASKGVSFGIMAAKALKTLDICCVRPQRAHPALRRHRSGTFSGTCPKRNGR